MLKATILAILPRQAAWTFRAISHSRIFRSLLAFNTAKTALNKCLTILARVGSAKEAQKTARAANIWAINDKSSTRMV